MIKVEECLHTFDALPLPCSEIIVLETWQYEGQESYSQIIHLEPAKLSVLISLVMNTQLQVLYVWDMVFHSLYKTISVNIFSFKYPITRFYMYEICVCIRRLPISEVIDAASTLHHTTTIKKTCCFEIYGLTFSISVHSWWPCPSLFLFAVWCLI